MDLKQSAPQVTDSALRLPPDFPELPGEVVERFPEMTTWMDSVNRFWSQNVNAVDEFARSMMDVQHVAGVLSVDPNEGSVYVKMSKGAGAFRDPDTPFYVDSQGRFSLGANLYWQDGRLVISSDGGSGIVDWGDITNIPGELTDGRIPTAINSAGLIISGAKPGIVVSPGGISGLYMGSDFLGYYNGATWKTYMDNAGNFYLGGVGGSLQWDGTNLVISGAITATTGTIGGFTIASNHIRDTSNSFGLASVVSGSDDVRFWAGASFASRATAPCRITESGALFLGTAGQSLSWSGSTLTITGTYIGTGASGNYVTIGSSGIDMGADATKTKMFYANSGTAGVRFRTEFNGNIGYTLNDSNIGAVVQFSGNGAASGSTLILRSTDISMLSTVAGTTPLSIFATAWLQFTFAGELSLGAPGFYSGSGAGLTNLNASNITSGTISSNRLPGALQLGNGSTSFPTYSFSSDPDTGWRWQSSGDMRAVTNGSDRLVVRDGAVVLIVPLKFETANVGAGLTPTGYVTAQDNTGSTIRLLTG